MVVCDAPDQTQLDPEHPASGERRVTGPDCGLPRGQRITSSLLFQETFDGGVRFAGRVLVLWMRNASDASLRLGVVASKKTFPRAIERSRAKRLLREAYRLNRYQFCGKHDVVLLARRSILSVGRQEVEQDLLILARRAGICGRQSGS